MEQRLEEAGFKVFIDRKMEAGESFREQLSAELDQARAVLVLWSLDSVKRKYVAAEAERAWKANKLICAKLDPVTPPFPFSEDHATDLVGFRPGEEHAGLELLLRGLAKRLGRPWRDREEEDAVQGRRWARLRRLRRVAVLVAGVCAVLGLIFQAAGVLDGFFGVNTRLRLLSMQARSSSARSSEELAVVLLDQDAMDAMTNRPLPGQGPDTLAGEYGRTWRAHHAQVLRELVRARAAVVALDVSFRPYDGRDPRVAPGTAALAAAIRQARAAGTAVAIVATKRDEAGRLAAEPDLRKALEAKLPTPGFIAHGCVGHNDGWALRTPVVLLQPDGAPPLRSLALATVEGLRRATLVPDLQDRALVLAADGRTFRIPVTGREKQLRERKEGCAVLASGQVPVQFLLDRFPRLERSDPRVVPYDRVHAGEAERERFAGKAVLVAVEHPSDLLGLRTCSGLRCGRWQVPFAAVHLATIDGLLNRGALHTLAPWEELLWVGVFCLAAAWIGLSGHGRRSVRRWALAGLMTVDLALVLSSALVLDLLVDGLYHLIAMGAAFSLAGYWERRR